MNKANIVEQNYFYLLEKVKAQKELLKVYLRGEIILQDDYDIEVNILTTFENSLKDIIANYGFIGKI